MDNKELHRLFEQRLKPKLAPLESARVATLQKRKTLAISVGAFFIAVFIAVDSTVLLLLLFAIMMYCFVTFKFSWNQFRSNYKQHLMTTLLSEIDPSLRWDKDKYIAQEEFEQSGLHHKKIDYYYGEDLIYGELEGVKIEMSELHVAQLKLTHVDSSSRTPIFEGLFFKAQSSAPFEHYSYILPVENAEQGLVDKIFAPHHNIRIGKKVPLPQSEFSRYFSVVSSEPESILKILTPELMKTLVEYREQKLQGTIALSFVAQDIYIAIADGRELFEPKLDVAVTDFDTIAELWQDLLFFTGLLGCVKLSS